MVEQLNNLLFQFQIDNFQMNKANHTNPLAVLIGEKPTMMSEYMEKIDEQRVLTIESSEVLSLTAASAESGGENVDDGYKKLIDRIDQDVRDHKQETRDRDARLQSEMKEREERYKSEMKEREERTLGVIKDLKTNIQADMQEIKSSVNRSEDRIAAATQHIQSLNVAHKWGGTTAVISIIAALISLISIVIAIWLGVHPH